MQQLKRRKLAHSLKMTCCGRTYTKILLACICEVGTPGPRFSLLDYKES